jgi:hypothetical protein
MANTDILMLRCDPGFVPGEARSTHHVEAKITR